MSNGTGFPIAALALLAALALVAPAPARAADPEALGFERTPPRLAYVDGEVSFSRPEAPDWSEAVINTPLAAGDALYAAEGANLEVQIGSRAYLRAGEQTELALTSLEPDFLQIGTREGHVSLDLRTLVAGQTFEIDTPNAAFTIERSGYYRVEVDGDTTTFITRRGGRASVTPAQGATMALASSEQVVIRGFDAPQLETYAAPELDGWDRWNYARTDAQLDAVSARYVPSSVYGVDDLDHHGDWRVVPTYGSIWVPRAVPVGWAPYTTGRWIHDPYYGWTWVDASPWGWAPYHYGRWVHVSGYWGWAPGPLVVRPYYAPALVAFFGNGVSVGISVGGPRVGWLPLGWGEPLIPWWGPRGFRGSPRWAGWGGPRVVNRVVIKQKTVIHVREIREYENARVRNAFVAVNRDRFGRRDMAEKRLSTADLKGFKRFDGDVDVRPTRESLAPSNRAGRRPPSAWQERVVVATRAPRPAPVPKFDAEPVQAGKGKGKEVSPSQVRRAAEPRVRVVERPRPAAGRSTFERPPFGTRGEGERATPPPAPRYRREPEREVSGRPATPERAVKTAPAGSKRATAPATPAPTKRERATAPTPTTRERATAPAPATPERQVQPRASGAREQPRNLPGEPANRVYRQREPRVRSDASPAPATREPRASGGGQPRGDTGGRGKKQR